MVGQTRDYGQEAIVKHRATRGKVSIAPKLKVETLDDLSITYTPGVASVCMAIAEDKSESYHLTNRANTVAIVTDGRIKPHRAPTKSGLPRRCQHRRRSHPRRPSPRKFVRSVRTCSQQVRGL